MEKRMLRFHFPNDIPPKVKYMEMQRVISAKPFYLQNGFLTKGIGNGDDLRIRHKGLPEPNAPPPRRNTRAGSALRALA